jgi:hypothetical protein
MDEKPKDSTTAIKETEQKPRYEPPRIRVMTEQEVLSSFQVTAAGTTMWWV